MGALNDGSAAPRGFPGVMLAAVSAVAIVAAFISIADRPSSGAVAAPNVCAGFTSDDWKIATGSVEGGSASQTGIFAPGDRVHLDFDFEKGSYLLSFEDPLLPKEAKREPVKITGPMTMNIDFRATNRVWITITKTSDTPDTQARVTAASCEAVSSSL